MSLTYSRFYTRNSSLLRHAGVAVIFAALALLLVRLALHQPLIAAVALAASAFLCLAWKRPQYALLVVFAACPFQSDVSGGGLAKFSIAEATLILTLPVFIAHMVVRKRLPVLGPIALPILAYLGVCAYSSSVHWLGDVALLSITQMVLYFIVVVAVFASFVEPLDKLRCALYALVVIGTILSIAAMATGFGFMGLNKNGIGASLSCAILVGAELWLSARSPRLRVVLTVPLAIIAAGLLLSLSRGAWLGAIGGIAVIFALRRQWATMGRMLLLLLPVLAVCWMLLPSESRDYATGFGSDRANIEARYQSIDLAESLYDRSPMIGEGVGLRKEYDATNLLLMTLAETGVLGLVTFLMIHVAFFSAIVKAQRSVPATQPLFSYLTIGAALILCQFMHGLVDHYWSRGAIMAAWASAGMAMGVYIRIPRRKLR